MSQTDKIQLSVLWVLVFITGILAYMVWEGTFGEPKYNTNAVETTEKPNWFTEDEPEPYKFTNKVDAGAVKLQGTMPETIENSQLQPAINVQ